MKDGDFVGISVYLTSIRFQPQVQQLNQKIADMLAEMQALFVLGRQKGVFFKRPMGRSGKKTAMDDTGEYQSHGFCYINFHEDLTPNHGWSLIQKGVSSTGWWCPSESLSWCK